MKFSEAMLKGFEQVEGRQTAHFYFRDQEGDMTVYADDAHFVCVLGAIKLGLRDCSADATDAFDEIFQHKWGMSPMTLNDDGMPWEHIYGMAVAAGL